jgi:hypothetical protein
MSNNSIFKRNTALWGLVLAVAVASGFFVSFNITHASAGNDIEVRFGNDLSESELAELLHKYDGATLKELYFDHGDIQGGYVLSTSQTSQEAFGEMRKEHLNLIQVLRKEKVSLQEGGSKDRDEKLHAALGKSEALLKNSDFKVNGVVIGGNFEAALLTDDAIIEEVKVKEQRKVDEAILIAATSYYVAPRLWYPTKGTAKVDKSLAYNTFYFNDASGFDMFGGILTYEHETQVYDTKFADYGGYWSSNLPNAYKDTPFLDTLDNFTVGSAKASSIVANTKYYTSMSLKAGSASTATVRIKGQLGHRYPSGCYSTWCIYADMTTPTLKLLTAPITSSVSWTYTP